MSKLIAQAMRNLAPLAIAALGGFIAGAYPTAHDAFCKVALYA